MNGQAVCVRPKRAEDRDFILGLANRLMVAGRPPWRDEERMRDFHRHYAEATAEASGEGEIVLLAEDQGGTPLGVVHVTAETSGLTGERQAYLATLAVSEAAEGRGVGRALLEAGEEWARRQGFRLLALDVFAHNTHARAFYARLGFREETLKLVKEL